MQTIQRFNRIFDGINCLYHKASVKMGLADSELNILYLLYDYTELCQTDIINYTGMSKQTIHSAIRRMEKDEWVVLGKRTQHRRTISLTPKGEQVVKEIMGPFIQAETQIFDDWTQEEIDSFIQLISRYRDSLRQVVNNLEKR